MNKLSNRNFSLDLVRTFAIVLMVIFHFIYDLKLFGWVEWDTPDGIGWRQFRWVIISLFFLALGVSLAFAHQANIRYRKFIIRLTQISAGALLISIGSYLGINENWIFFGVLHFLAFASVVAVWFANKPRLSLAIGIGVFVLAGTGWLSPRWPFHLLFSNLPDYTNDFVAPIPWLGVVYIGIFLGHTRWLKSDPFKPWRQFSYSRWLVLPGQHGLIIYLLHQPILIGALYLISILL